MDQISSPSNADSFHGAGVTPPAPSQPVKSPFSWLNVYLGLHVALFVGVLALGLSVIVDPPHDAMEWAVAPMHRPAVKTVIKSSAATQKMTPASYLSAKTAAPRVLGVTTSVPSSVANLSIRADFVSYLYRCMLVREPDQAGLDYWVGTMVSDPDPVNHLYRAFYQDGSFNKSLSNSDFVTRMYQCVLFRQPNDPPDNNFSGRDFWTNEMNLNHQTQNSMLEVFLNSTEYKTNILPKLSALPKLTPYSALLTASASASYNGVTATALNGSTSPSASSTLSVPLNAPVTIKWSTTPSAGTNCHVFYKKPDGSSGNGAYFASGASGSQATGTGYLPSLNMAGLWHFLPQCSNSTTNPTTATATVGVQVSSASNQLPDFTIIDGSISPKLPNASNAIAVNTYALAKFTVKNQGTVAALPLSFAFEYTGSINQPVTDNSTDTTCNSSLMLNPGQTCVYALKVLYNQVTPASGYASIRFDVNSNSLNLAKESDYSNNWMVINFDVRNANSVPTLTSLSQVSGPVGASITVNGTDLGLLGQTTTVRFGTTSASYGLGSGPSIQGVIVPNLAPGIYPVTVQVGSFVTNALNFTITSSVSGAYSISGITGNQTNYTPNSSIEFSVKTNDGKGQAASTTNGYNMQAYVFPASDTNFSGSYLPPNPANSYNGTYDPALGYWKFKMSSPIAVGSYNLRVVLYCSVSGSTCYNAGGHGEESIKILPFSITAATSANKKPIGYLDIIQDGKAYGWSYDPDDSSKVNSVNFYIDGTDASHLVGGTFANSSRPDVNQVLHVSGDHGFAWTIPDKYKDGNQHTLYVFGIDLNETSGSSNAQLNRSPQKFTLNPSSVIQILLSNKSGKVGQSFSSDLSASGGAGPYGFALTSSSLPPGLSVGVGAGPAILGTPTQTGSFTFNITATDSQGRQGSQSFTIVIASDTVIAGPTTAKEFITHLYVCALGRQPEDPNYSNPSSGPNFWLNQFRDLHRQRSQPVDDMYRAFFLSIEFQNRKLSNQDYVSRLFQCALFRAASQGEITTWRAKLDGNQPRESVLEEFLATRADFSPLRQQLLLLQSK